MCSVGSSSNPGVGTDKRLAIGDGTVLGGGAPGAGAGGPMQTILGGMQRTGSGTTPSGPGSTRTNPKPNLNR